MKHLTAQVEGLVVSGHTDARSCSFPAPRQVLSQDDVLCSAWRHAGAHMRVVAGAHVCTRVISLTLVLGWDGTCGPGVGQRRDPR